MKNLEYEGGARALEEEGALNAIDRVLRTAEKQELETASSEQGRDEEEGFSQTRSINGGSMPFKGILEVASPQNQEVEEGQQKKKKRRKRREEHETSEAPLEAQDTFEAEPAYSGTQPVRAGSPNSMRPSRRRGRSKRRSPRNEPPSLATPRPTSARFRKYDADRNILSPIPQNSFPPHGSQSGFAPYYHPLTANSPDYRLTSMPLNRHTDDDEVEYLSFTVPIRCTHATLHSRFSASMQQNWPTVISHSDLGESVAQDVHHSQRFKKGDGHYSVKLSGSRMLQGLVSEDCSQLRWLHMQRDNMDLAEFEDMALNAPKLVPELKYLILQLFKRLRDSRRAKFASEFHIEPGTVLRSDGTTSKSPDETDLSATFLCFPYLTLRHKSKKLNSASRGYPIRTILQTLYPYESTIGQDVSPTFCKDLPRASRAILYVAQLWVVIIGSKYLVTCSESDFRTVQGASIASSIGMLPSKDSAFAQDARAAHAKLKAFVNCAHPLPKDPYGTTQPQPLTLGHPSGSAAEGDSIVRHLVIPSIEIQGEQTAPSSGLSDALSLPTEAIRTEIRKALLGTFSGLEERHMRTLLTEIEPEQNAQYLTIFLNILKGLLTARDRPKVVNDQRFSNVIAQLDHASLMASLFMSMVELENHSGNEFFRDNLGYRDAMVKDLASADTTMAEAILSVKRAIEDALRFFHDLSGFGSGLSTLIAPLPHRDDPFQAESVDSPFLTWARPDFDTEEGMPAGRLASEHLFAILEEVEQNVSRRNESLASGVNEVSLQELRRKMPFYEVALSPNSPIDIPGRRNSLSRQNTKNRKDSPRRSLKGRQPTETEFSITDSILAAQKEQVLSTLNDLCKTVKEFVNFFIPLKYNHGVSKRIWGALDRMMLSIHRPSDESPPARRRSYMIRPRSTGAPKEFESVEARSSFKTCSSCQIAHGYRSFEGAYSHLDRYHFQTTTHLLPPGTLEMECAAWICSEQQLRDEVTNEQQLHLLRICLTYLRLLQARAKKLYDGITANPDSEISRNLLPNDLVGCFETSVLFILQAAVSLVAIKDEIHAWHDCSVFLREENETPMVRHALMQLGKLGQSAQASMTRAEKVMALSDPETGMLSMGPVGPEFLAVVISQNLQRKELLEKADMDIYGLYQKCASNLQYQINRFPRKRLLPDIHELQEELSVIKLVNDWQQKAYHNYLLILDPESYASAPSGRAAFFTSEKDCLQAELKNLRSKAAELDALENRTRQLREQLKQSVEILEEDHGKAILVFTMITTIFLPLSFITSFFGMNTADIRTTDRNQGFFWAIALPITVSIVGIAVLFAYQGDKLHDIRYRLIHRLREDWANRRASSGHDSSPDAERRVSAHPWNLRKRKVFSRIKEEFDSVLPV